MAGDLSITSPSTPPPPPPPPLPPPHASNPLMLYYGLVVIGTAATVLAMYNLIIIKWCADNRQRHDHRRRSGQGMARALEPISSRSFDNPNLQLVASFSYKKGQRVAEDQGYESDYECPICLSVFEEGEELRRLRRCKHIFHAPCIDMWLYSHFDCPVCRTPVGPPVLGRHTTADQLENSREGLLDSGIPD